MSATIYPQDSIARYATEFPCRSHHRITRFVHFGLRKPTRGFLLNFDKNPPFSMRANVKVTGDAQFYRASSELTAKLETASTWVYNIGHVDDVVEVSMRC
jgi:hypothetical protein